MRSISKTGSALCCSRSGATCSSDHVYEALSFSHTTVSHSCWSASLSTPDAGSRQITQNATVLMRMMQRSGRRRLARDQQRARIPPACEKNGIVTSRRRQMKTFSALLAFCAGNSPVTGEFPSQRPVLMFSLICAWTNSWANNGDAGDLRRHCAPYDVTIVNSLAPGGCSNNLNQRCHLRTQVTESVLYFD